jgi:type I restriction enzyme S subunit
MNMRPYLRAANVTWQGLALGDVKEMHFDPAEVETYRLKAGDVLVAEASGSRSEVGKPAIWRAELHDCCFQNTLLRVRSRGPLPEYLLYFLKSEALEGRLGDVARGVGIYHIGAAGLSTYRLPVPPLDEQRRIVNVIEEHFSRLDAGWRLLVSLMNRIERLRGAVLDRMHQIDSREIPLDAVASMITDGDHRPPPRVASGVPHLTAKHVRKGRLMFDGCTFVSEEGYAQTSRRYAPQAGDVVITCVGTIGETAVVPEGVRFSADRNLAAVRLQDDQNHMTPQYLQMVLSSPSYRQLLAAASGSTAQPHLYLRDLRALKVPVPALYDQQEMVREAELALSLADALGTTVERSLHRSAQLRRSVLQRAFSGRLTGQDPTDETGTELLARGTTRRAVTAKPGRRNDD